MNYKILTALSLIGFSSQVGFADEYSLKDLTQINPSRDVGVVDKGEKLRAIAEKQILPNFEVNLEDIPVTSKSNPVEATTKQEAVPVLPPVPEVVGTNLDKVDSSSIEVSDTAQIPVNRPLAPQAERKFTTYEEMKAKAAQFEKDNPDPKPVAPVEKDTSPKSNGIEVSKKFSIPVEVDKKQPAPAVAPKIVTPPAEVKDTSPKSGGIEVSKKFTLPVDLDKKPKAKPVVTPSLDVPPPLPVKEEVKVGGVEVSKKFGIPVDLDKLPAKTPITTAEPKVYVAPTPTKEEIKVGGIETSKKFNVPVDFDKKSKKEVAPVKVAEVPVPTQDVYVGGIETTKSFDKVMPVEKPKTGDAQVFVPAPTKEDIKVGGIEPSKKFNLQEASPAVEAVKPQAGNDPRVEDIKVGGIDTSKKFNVPAPVKSKKADASAFIPPAEEIPMPIPEPVKKLSKKEKDLAAKKAKTQAKTVAVEEKVIPAPQGSITDKQGEIKPYTVTVDMGDTVMTPVVEVTKVADATISVSQAAPAINEQPTVIAAGGKTAPVAASNFKYVSQPVPVGKPIETSPVPPTARSEGEELDTLQVAEADTPKWEIKAGDTLFETVRRWAELAGWNSVTWKANKNDIRFKQAAFSSEPFDKAVKAVFRSLPKSTGLRAIVDTKAKSVTIVGQ